MKIRALMIAALSGNLFFCAHAAAEIETVTYDGVIPETSLGAFFTPDDFDYADVVNTITGIQKFDPSLGTLIDIQMTARIDHFIDMFVEGQGILSPGIPHQVDARMAQHVVGIFFANSTGGIAGLAVVEPDYGVACFGEPGDEDACFDVLSTFSGFRTTDVSLIDFISVDDMVGTGEVDIFTIEIAFSDVYFNLNNIGTAFFDVYTEIDPSTAQISITYVYDTGGGPDADGDGVEDSLDSCINHANADQIDSDADGYGDACDMDVNNDCIVNVADLGALRVGFFGTDPVLDFNNDGAVNATDLGIMRQNFFTVPGPSALTNTCD